ncbi:hypothetical protein FLM09_10540 [Vibrio cholerae]|nr:hypothetical protein FLM09_10540 [Vibrio cholerae]
MPVGSSIPCSISTALADRKVVSRYWCFFTLLVLLRPTASSRSPVWLRNSVALGWSLSAPSIRPLQ